MKTAEIKKEIYGPGGLYERVVEKIIHITPREASIITGKSTQNLNVFRSMFEKNIIYKNGGYEIIDTVAKATTIFDYAEALGVD